MRSTARELYRVAALLQGGDYPIAVVALDLDHPILDAATAAAQALELAGKRGQLGLGSADPRIVVTVFPPRPCVSRRTRTTPSPRGGAGGLCGAGAIRPLPVE